MRNFIASSSLVTSLLSSSLTMSQVAIPGVKRPAEGSEHQHGSHVECPLPKSAMDVLQCAMNEHPKVRRARFTAESTQTLTAVAEKIPNPDLDVESAFGNGNASSLDIALLQPIEWGGKRSSRIKSANAEIAQMTAQQKEAQAEVVIQTIQNLHRLRQLTLESELHNDTVSTLQKIISQQSARPALTPEQQVALSVFRMSLADAKIRQSEVFEEEREIEHYFHVSTGHSLDEVRAVLPKSPKAWPEISTQPASRGPSPSVAEAIATRDFSEAELSVARAGSWPSLRLGPMIKMGRNREQNENLYGFRLMMDLPVFNLNGAGQEHARAGLNKSQQLVSLTKSEEDHERAEQLKIYRSAVQALKSAPTLEFIEKDFRKGQTFARRGIISATLMIEFHRQRLDLVRSRNGREMKALQALWLLYKYDSRIFSESI